MTRTVTIAERRARLAHRHHLLPHTRIDDVGQLADDLLSLHSSDPATVFLSALVRMANPSRETIEQALYADRSLVRQHAMRRTLWVATRDTMAVMSAAAGRKVADTERRKTLTMLEKSGIATPERWLTEASERVLALLREHGALSTRQIGELLPELTAKVKSTPGNPKSAMISLHSRVLVQLGFDGHIIRTRPGGTWTNSTYLWAETASWLGTPPAELDPQHASAQLADHWLRRFGPGTTTDLQWWLGWTKTDTHRALTAANAVPVDLEDSSEPGWISANDPAADMVTGSDAEPWIAVLPSLDATTMGWKQRSWYLPDRAQAAFDANGNAGCTIWVDGRVVGAWTQAKDGALRHLWFEQVPAGRRRQVAQRLDEVRHWLGDTVVAERFPGLSRRTLLAQ